MKNYNRLPGPAVCLVWCFLCFGSLLCGCRLFDSYRYGEILLPPVPEAWACGPRITGYRIVWPGGEFGVDTGKDAPDSAPEGVVLELPAERYVPVLAYPETGAGRGGLRPAGGFTSLPGTAGREVELSYFLGPAAEVLYTCMRGKSSRPVSDCSPVASFNVPRFVDEFRSRAGDDPWMVDLRRIETALSTGNFRADLIRPEDPRRLSLPAGFVSPGLWVAGNPFAPVSEALPGERLEIDIAPGEYWFFLSGEGESLHIIADEEEWNAVSSGEYGLSGRW